MATISLGAALIASVRHRARELSVLRALGFTGGQLGTAVAWHATAVAVTGVLAGVPVGMVASRQLWRLFSEQLHILDEFQSVLWPAVLIVSADGPRRQPRCAMAGTSREQSSAGGPLARRRLNVSAAALSDACRFVAVDFLGFVLRNRAASTLASALVDDRGSWRWAAGLHHRPG